MLIGERLTGCPRPSTASSVTGLNAEANDQEEWHSSLGKKEVGEALPPPSGGLGEQPFTPGGTFFQRKFHFRCVFGGEGGCWGGSSCSWGVWGQGLGWWNTPPPQRTHTCRKARPERREDLIAAVGWVLISPEGSIRICQ